MAQSRGAWLNNHWHVCGLWGSSGNVLPPANALLAHHAPAAQPPQLHCRAGPHLHRSASNVKVWFMSAPSGCRASQASGEVRSVRRGCCCSNRR